MRSIKRLRSVVHSLGHHAISGLCYVHPHLGQARKRIGVREIAVNLLRPETFPPIEPLPREIELSTSALREQFVKLVGVERLNMQDIKSAFVLFAFKGSCIWPDACFVSVETTDGKVIRDAVGSDGRRAQILRANKRLQWTMKSGLIMHSV